MPYYNGPIPNDKEAWNMDFVLETNDLTKHYKTTKEIGRAHV